MGSVRVISTTTVQQQPTSNGGGDQEIIHLTPWDIHFHAIGAIQKGLLFHQPPQQDTATTIHHLQQSFSTTLSFFPLLAGRLFITHHHDHTSSASSYILCNNAGALFVHAVAEATTIADILRPKYVPSIVHSFFPLNGANNHQGTSQPLLAVQLTELVDGIFIGCTLNHVVGDGGSFWHFINSWAEISRGSHKPSRSPSFQRWFLDGAVEPPIRFPFDKEDFDVSLEPLPERFFHFTKEKIAQLKAKANAEANTASENRATISSLQALLTHLWRSVFRCSHRFEAEEELTYMVLVGVRPRLVPPLPKDYFGNAAMVGRVTVKARELLDQGGFGKCALEMNRVRGSHSDEKIRSQYQSWVRNPSILRIGNFANKNILAMSSSPRFDVYGNDFGWGKPVAVRSGGANKRNGKISVFAGADQGSIDIEVCLPFEILDALGNDPDFMDPK